MYSAEWLILSSPVLVPLLCLAVARFLAPYSLGWQLAAACLGGAASGVFLAFAASAMTPATSLAVVLLRGAGLGMLEGLLAGGLMLILIFLWRLVADSFQ